MLTKEENEYLSQIGPGTPCGELMRRYWHPVATTAQLEENPVRNVRILCEDLTLYRDRSGTLGLLGPRCPHRLVDLQFGIPEETGLRCPYHGWLFDQSGECLEMPLEPPESVFRDKIRTKSYPAQELGGLIWAYLGPDPTPLLPRWDLFVREGGLRQIMGHWLPCNWLQVMENRQDIHHTVYLHGRLFQYVLERQGRLTDDPAARYNETMRQQADRQRKGVYLKLRLTGNDYGYAKAAMDSDLPDDDPLWGVGAAPGLFPYIGHTTTNGGQEIRQDYQIGVPVDDTTTWHISYRCYSFPKEMAVPEQRSVPYVEVPLKDENGSFILDYVLAQDMVAWYAQGELVDRSQEHLGYGDSMIIQYRKMLKEQIDLVKNGAEPMNVFRDAAKNVHLQPVIGRFTREGSDVHRKNIYRSNFHKMSKGGWRYIEDDVDRYCPDKDLILELYERTERLTAGG